MVSDHRSAAAGRALSQRNHCAFATNRTRAGTAQPGRHRAPLPESIAPYFFGTTMAVAEVVTPRFSARFSLMDFEGFLVSFWLRFSPMGIPHIAEPE